MLWGSRDSIILDPPTAVVVYDAVVVSFGLASTSDGVREEDDEDDAGDR